MNDQTIPLKDLAELFDLTERRIQQLADDGIIKKSRRGEYELFPSVQGYIEFLKNSANGTSSGLAEQRLRQAKAKADREELELKALTGDLVEKSDAIAAWGEAVQMMKTMLLSIPAKVAQSVRVAKSDAEAKSIIEERIKKTLNAIVNVEIQRSDTDSEDQGE